MASLSLSPLPASMSNRRAPLSNNPNAINSPFRTVTASTTTSKSKRPHANIQREEIYDQLPPAKKQLLETHQVLQSIPRHHTKQPATVGIQSRKENGLQQALYERKTLKALEKTQRATIKVDRSLTDDHESIRQWQKHNRRMFPSFVFYFENVAMDAQTKYSKAVMSLGAREEKFFSNTVTHVITTRNIPPEIQAVSITLTMKTSNSQSQKYQSQTNCASLDRSTEHTDTSELASKPNFSNETLPDKKIPPNINMVDSRKQLVRSTDVLQKARELGMKIWSLEKLERIVNVIFDRDVGYQVYYANSFHVNSNSTSISRLGRETDLQQLLRNEKINGPSDRDLTVATKELYVFRGPYIYIHDIDENQKPIMVREYPKVCNKEDGDWPQFRSVSNGKCPFIDEVDYNKREAEREMEQVRIRRHLEKAKGCDNGKDTLINIVQQPAPLTDKRILEERYNDVDCSIDVTKKPKISTALSKKSTQLKSQNVASLKGNAFVSRAVAGRLHEGEPIASGVQPAITSAIRSTMSSTAAQPGHMVGTNKEVHGMQRKVLEKKFLTPDSNDLHIPQWITDNGSGIQEESTLRTYYKKLSKKLTLIDENVEQPQSRDISQKAETIRKNKSAHHPSTIRQECKPGYCENCQEKFEDFNEHILSRKHRKFAEKLENWRSLDELLAQLARPLRKNIDYNHL